MLHNAHLINVDHYLAEADATALSLHIDAVVENTVVTLIPADTIVWDKAMNTLEVGDNIIFKNDNTRPCHMLDFLKV